MHPKRRGPDHRHPRLLVLLIVVLGVVLPGMAIAAPTQTVEVGGRVTKVSGKGKQLRVTIDKGTKAGVKVGMTGELYPMRTSEGSNTSSVDFDVRLALGRVVRVQDLSAELSIEALADSVEVGAHFTYKIEVDDALAESTLFRITAMGIQLRPQYEDVPHITLEAMLADPSEALRNKALDAMIADVRKMKDIVESTLTQRIEEGKHHGKSAGQIVDELDRAQLLEFLLFVEAFPGKYIGHRWKMPEVYFTWIINGTPSGERDRKLRKLATTIAAAKEAERASKIDDARAGWQRVLREVPDHTEAVAAVKRIDKILMLQRQIAGDPDDTATRYQLMDELYNLDAYDLAMRENDALRTRKYEPFKVDRMRAQLLVRLKKWRDAEASFVKLVKAKPDNTSLAMWLDYTRAQAKIARSPGDPAAHMELALVNERDNAWDAALTAYRKVLESNRATPKHREAVKQAQERISIRKELDQRLAWARSDIKKHDLKMARDRIGQAMRLVDKLADPKQAAKVIEDLSEVARSVSEEELALELLRRRVELVPGDHGAHTALAYALLTFDRFDEAEAVVTKSLDVKGDHDYAYLILAYIARARDDMAAMHKHAERAAKDTTYAWPLVQLARVEAARGNWQQANAHARRALELLESGYDMRQTHMAVMRGMQAHEALQANPSSPRERLRLVRALAQLGLHKQVADEIAKLPADGTWRTEAWWSLAESTDSRLLLRDRLNAARNAKPTLEYRKHRLAQLEARAALRSNPKDEAARITLARLYIQAEDFDLGLATLSPLMTGASIKPAVGDLVHNARQGLRLVEQFELAQAAATRRDFQVAEKLVLEYQQVHDRIGSLYSRIGARELRSMVLSEQGRYPEAIALAEEARAISVQLGDPSSISVGDRRIAGLRANIGTNDALLAALRSSLTTCEELDDENCLFYVHNQLASLELDEGRTAQAIEHARKSWSLAERIGRADLARGARFTLADSNLVSGRYSDAEQLALKLLADSRKHDDVNSEQLSLMVLGYVAMFRGEGKAARARFQEVYDLGTRTGDTTYRALARRFEGTAWLRSDHDPVKAATALEQAASLYESLGEGWAVNMRGGVLRELADAHLQAEKLPLARKAAEQGLALAQRFGRRPALASAQGTLALIAAKEGKADEAIKHAKQALDFAQQTDQAGLLWGVWHALARAHELKGQTKEAVDAYEKALEYLNQAMTASGGESAQQGYVNTGRVREVYTDAVEMLLEVGKTSRAMEVLESSRAALTRQSFDATKIQTSDAALRARLDKLEQIRARVAALEKQRTQALDKAGAAHSTAQVKALGERIAKTREELKQVVLDLKVTHRNLFRALAVDPQSLHDRRQELPADSVLVEYFVADDALYAFVIAANLAQPAVVKIKATGAELEKTIKRFREEIMNETEEVETVGRQLEDWLLEPLRSYLTAASTIIIVPFGPLYYVPFDALVVSDPGKPLRYAVEDYRLTVQTGDTLEQLLRPTRPRGSGTMLAVSNPDGTLPGAQREVNKIVKTALPDAQVLGRKEATVKKFQDVAGGFRFLHIATHGVLDADPRKSYLKLADGPLTVEQIAKLDLKQSNELVVLSACDTAVETGATAGDDMVSVAIAFSMAGSPALVASLWEVSDDSTAELMAMFYRALAQGTGDRLDALRTAKLNLLRTPRSKSKFGTPWHWSAFQLYGDFRAPRS